MGPISLPHIFANCLDIASRNWPAPAAARDRIIIVATTRWRHLLTSCQRNSGFLRGIQFPHVRRPALMLIITGARAFVVVGLTKRLNKGRCAVVENPARAWPEADTAFADHLRRCMLSFWWPRRFYFQRGVMTPRVRQMPLALQQHGDERVVLQHFRCVLRLHDRHLPLCGPNKRGSKSQNCTNGTHYTATFLDGKVGATLFLHSSL